MAENWDANSTAPNSSTNVFLTANSSTLVVDDVGSAATLTVGSASGSANLAVDYTYFETSGLAVIGHDSGTTGAVTFTGSTWNMSLGGPLVIGDYGTGSLILQTTANLDFGTDVQLGVHSGSSGSLLLNNSSMALTGTLTIGDQGSGTVTMSGASSLSAAGIVVGGNGCEGVLALNQNDTWGNHTATASVPITINAGGRVENGVGYYNTLVNLTLNGGELRSNHGFDAGFPAWQLKGTVTVGGTQASTMTVGDGTTAALTAIQIGDNTVGGATTFNVANATGNGEADLTIDNKIINGFDGSIVPVASRLIKTGAGTLVLNGTNTYSGGTTINGGTLVSNGGFSGALGLGAVMVNSGGTLAGDDAIAGLVTVNSGGHLLTGNPTGPYGGVLRFDGGLTLSSDAVLDFNLSSGSALWFTMGANSTLTGPGSGTVTINFYDFGDFTADTYTLIDFSASNVSLSSFDLADFVVGNTISGYDFVLSLSGTALEVTATATAAVPEPSAYAALFGAGAIGLALIRRRRLVAA